MRRILFLLLLGAASTARASMPLTLDEAIALGRANSRMLGVARSRSAAEQARAGEIGAQLYPGLRLTGGYQRISEGAFRLANPSIPLPLTVGNVVVDNWTFRVGLRQPLFTGFSLANAKKAAELSAEATGLEAVQAERDLVVNITAAYWLLGQARRVAALSAENVARLESYRRDTERLITAGLATRNDLLKVDVQLSGARIGRIEAENDAAVAMMNLNILLGLPPETETVPAQAPSGGEEVDTAQVELLLTEARGSRADYAAASARLASAEAGAGAARGLWWPQLELTAGYNFNSPNARYQPITPEFKGNWDVGVVMAFDIWNWGITGSRVEQAEAAEQQARLRAAQMHDDIALEVRRAALNLYRAREKLGVARLGTEQARENLRVTGDRYRAGAATSTELLDADVALFQSETLQEGARVDRAVARVLLDRAVGRFDPPAAGGEAP
jgi:outer membrane protein